MWCEFACVVTLCLFPSLSLEPVCVYNVHHIIRCVC
jgi:hypothetical protein